MSLLPDSVKAMAEFAPIEDVILPVLDARLPDISVQSWIADDQTFPFVLVRRSPSIQWWGGDPRFVDIAMVDIEALCEGDDADQDAAVLSEAVRVALRDSWLQHDTVPSRGSIVEVTMQIAPHRRPDWAIATGPVQYADLPTGVIRYEATYRIKVRRPKLRPFPQ